MNKKKTTFIILFITVLIYCLIGFCCYDLKSKNKELFILKNFNNDSKVVNSEKDNDNDQNEYLDQFNNDDYYLSIKAKANALKNIEKISYNEKDNFYIYIPLLNQAKIPNGCEAVAATMYLNYLGFNITTSEFINKYLKKDKAYVINNIIYGPDPSVYYVGDPYSGYGWGAFAPAITNDLNDFFKNSNSKYYAENKTLTNLITLAKYKEPVIIWITTTYEPINELRAIRSYDESDSFIYPHNSHTVLLIGQDKDYYYINDSLKSNSVQKVLKKTLEESYDSNGRQAVIIRSN